MDLDDLLEEFKDEGRAENKFKNSWGDSTPVGKSSSEITNGSMVKDSWETQSFGAPL